MHEERWSPKQVGGNKDEKLRIYESKLEGKLQQWSYLVKISITNLTDRDLLAMSVDLGVPKPEVTIAPDAKPQPVKYEGYNATRYDLLKKDEIGDSDLPLVLPAKSKIGVVFSGFRNFDHPLLVDKAPDIAEFCIRLDDGSSHEKIDSFTLKESIPDAYFRYNNVGTLFFHWGPYADKHELDEVEGDEIPF